MVYRVSSSTRTAKATQRNRVLKKKNIHTHTHTHTHTYVNKISEKLSPRKDMPDHRKV